MFTNSTIDKIMNDKKLQTRKYKLPLMLAFSERFKEDFSQG